MTFVFQWLGDQNDGGHQGGNTCGPNGPGCEKMIYLGEFSDMDGLFGFFASPPHQELGGKVLGDAENPLSRNLVDVHLNDSNRDGKISDNDGWPTFDYITHDVSTRDKNYQIDEVFAAKNTEVTFRNPDGSLETVTTSVRIMQDTSGHVFLMPPPAGAPKHEIELMTSRPVVSVRFSTSASDYDKSSSGIFTDRTCFAACFTSGTLIDTVDGPVAVEKLSVGDLVITGDHGAQPIRWIGSRTLDSLELRANPNLRPIRIRKGALGAGVPARDLVVSPQHRILVRSKIALKMFDTAEVLVAAKQLLQIDGIDIADDIQSVEYYHFMFDQHEIVYSNGAATESLYAGPEALKSIGRAAQEEIFALFPHLRDGSGDNPPAGARLLTSGRMARKLAVRHVLDGRALVQ